MPVENAQAASGQSTFNLSLGIPSSRQMPMNNGDITRQIKRLSASVQKKQGLINSTNAAESFFFDKPQDKIELKSTFVFFAKASKSFHCAPAEKPMPRHICWRAKQHIKVHTRPKKATFSFSVILKEIIPISSIQCLIGSPQFCQQNSQPTGRQLCRNLRNS